MAVKSEGEPDDGLYKITDDKTFYSILSFPTIEDARRYAAGRGNGDIKITPITPSLNGNQEGDQEIPQSSSAHVSATTGSSQK